MSVQRTSILRGPCKVAFAGGTFFSKDDVKVELMEETFDIGTSAHGKADTRLSNRLIKLSFTPAGEWENMSILWPYAATLPGTSLFTGTDRPCVITSVVDGKTLTLNAAAITKMPDIEVSATRTLIGNVEITGIGSDNVAWTTASSIVATASGTYSDSTFDPTAIKTVPPSLAWGATAPWSAFDTLDGVKVSFELKHSPLKTDADGIVDYLFDEVGVTARCIPVVAGGITETNVIDALVMQGAGAVRGQSLAQRANSNNLVITGAGGSPIITLTKAAPRKAELKYGSMTPRVGEIEWVACRVFSSGSPTALWTLS